MADLHLTIDTHLDAYGEADGARRSELLRRAWSAQGRLIDPPMEGSGHAGISELAELVHAHYPGHTFRRTSGIDEHHGFARYQWDLLGPDGAVALSGLDVAEIDDDGLLRRVVGFLGPVPPTEC